MKKEAMFHNVNHRFAETVMKNPGKSKSINQQLLQLISRIRSLQDNLLEEQYRYELLLQQSSSFKQKLNALRYKNEDQELELKQLDEQMELHKIKNKELHMCEESLLILEKQIQDLSDAAQRKEEECQIMKYEAQKVAEENREIQSRNKLTYQNNVYIKSLIQDFLNLRITSFQEDHPLDYLRVRLENLRQNIFEIENKEAQLKKQQFEKLNNQKEKTIKLQFQEQLLKQRENDEEKIKVINNICQNQQNLEKVVEEMLIKEDQLIAELKRSKATHQSLQKSVGEDLRKIEEEWDQEREMIYRQIRELKKFREKLIYEARDWQNQITQRKQRFAHMSQEQEMLLRMNEELSLMKRLRQAQQRNNYLKLKMKQASEIKRMLLLQKDVYAHPKVTY